MAKKEEKKQSKTSHVVCFKVIPVGLFYYSGMNMEIRRD